MKKLVVRLGDRSYPIVVGEGILRESGRVLTRCGFSSAPVVVADRRVLRLHGDRLLDTLRISFGPVPVIQIPCGERAKSHGTLLRVYEGLLRHRAHRESWIVAFGGGVTGDVAGFAAATFLRGIPYVQVPTTLLAQVDSAVGGKVAVNLAQGKNLVGAFHQPAAVLADIGVLRSLPRRDLTAGLYEVIKCAAIGSTSLLAFLERKLDGILACKSADLAYIVKASCEIKAGIVARDERERNLRMILNFGHTVGHALEAATQYRRFRHGEAVGWGMLAALEFGAQICRGQGGIAERLASLIRRAGPLPSLRGISHAELWRSLERDKKFRRGGIRMVLLNAPASPFIAVDLAPSLLRDFLKGFLAKHSQTRPRE